jgi:hypothetical protein
MPVIDYIDGPNRDIYLHPDTVGSTVSPIDIYREMRELRRTDESLRSFTPFMEAKGYDLKGPGKYTERYMICKDGTRIIPYDVTHQLTINGVIITDDGQEGIACFDRTPLSGSTVVDINYIPPQVEVIEVVVGGGVGTVQEVADAVWDANLSSHQNVGSTGEGLNAAGGGVTPATIADAVWSANISGYTNGTAGYELNNITIDNDAIANAVGIELTPDFATISSQIGALNDFDPVNDTVSRVTLVDVTTINTDMRGTDGAYTGIPPTAVEIAAEVNSDLSPMIANVDAIWKAHFRKRVNNKVDSTITIFEADNVTPEYIFDVNSDVSEITPR